MGVGKGGVGRWGYAGRGGWVWGEGLHILSVGDATPPGGKISFNISLISASYVHTAHL